MSRFACLASALLSCTAVLMLPKAAHAATPTVVAVWNQAALAEVRAAKLGPPVVARALAVAHTCIYDAWAPYDTRAVAAEVKVPRRPAVERVDANKAKAISFAAYRCLLNLFPAGAARLDSQMRSLGYDPADLSTSLVTPQGIGNAVANGVVANRRNDGSNQYGDLAPGAYADYTGYASLNAPMPFCDPLFPGPCPVNVLSPTTWQPLVSNAGTTQTYVAPHWDRVRPFALRSATQFDSRPEVANGPAYRRSMSAYLADIDAMIAYSASLDPARKLIVEYWADGPASELPPGHWGLFGQYVAQRDGHGIDHDAKMFFALHNASFDAGIVAWHLKRKYDGVRPITGVRYFKQGTQIVAWGGPGRPTEPIPGEKWSPYTPGSNLSPAFPGYISGHSTFSSASAEVLRSFTGSDAFGFSTVIPPGFGRVEPGVPAVPTTISYATFTAASDEAGESRLLGGIHFADDNTVGQTLGTLVGRQAFAKAQFLYDGGLAIDTAASTQGYKADTLSFRHTVPARSNRLLLVAVSFRDGNQSLTSVTYDGRPLAPLGAKNAPGNQNRTELWYLVAPPAGSASVVVSLSKGRDIVAGAASFTGVNQATPFGAVASAADQSSRACASLAGAPPLAAMFVSANGDADAIDPARSQAVIWNRNTGQAGGDIQSTGVTTVLTSGALCQTLATAKPWSLLAVPLNAALVP